MTFLQFQLFDLNRFKWICSVKQFCVQIFWWQLFVNQYLFRKNPLTNQNNVILLDNRKSFPSDGIWTSDLVIMIQNQKTNMNKALTFEIIFWISPTIITCFAINCGFGQLWVYIRTTQIEINNNKMVCPDLYPDTVLTIWTNFFTSEFIVFHNKL